MLLALEISDQYIHGQNQSQGYASRTLFQSVPGKSSPKRYAMRTQTGYLADIYVSAHLLDQILVMAEESIE